LVSFLDVGYGRVVAAADELRFSLVSLVVFSLVYCADFGTATFSAGFFCG
jgi:hypothetical protein